jgi:hypothetical protein
MKRTLNYAVLACAVATAPAALAEESTCYAASKAVTKAVAAKPDDVLAIVAKNIAASPGCACEIVKAAIVATEADKQLVGQIVGAAIEAAPDKAQVITTCAIAVAPDAISEIKAVLAKLGLAGTIALSGEDPVYGGAKGSKDAIYTGATVRDPLEGPYLIPGLPWIHPPTVASTCTPDEFPNIDIIGRPTPVTLPVGP